MQWIGQFRILALSDEIEYVAFLPNWTALHIDSFAHWHGLRRFSGTSVSHRIFHTVHNHCMSILQNFSDYQARSPSPHSPKLVEVVEELIVSWRIRRTDKVASLYIAHGDSRNLPSGWAILAGVEHSHLYFGARRFWTDPWDCVPGHEYLCADPLQDSKSAEFLSTFLARQHPNPNTLISSLAERAKSLKPLPLSHSNLGRLPREIYDLIISNLSLKEALSFCFSSPKLSEICDGTFWRLQTLRLHSCWLWELEAPRSFFPRDNWKWLLQLLTKSRSQIQEGAFPYWKGSSASGKAQTAHKGPINAELSTLSLPLGLRNRQRIWMCLETLGTKAEWEIAEVQHKTSSGHRL